MFLQKTLRKKTVVHGHGIHSGDPCTLTFKPAPTNTGVYFIRSDLPGNPFLKVSAKSVSATSYQTTISGRTFFSGDHRTLSSRLVRTSNR